MKNILSLRLQTLPPIRRTAWVLSLMAASFVWAGPGAHGPNGEHLDTAAAPSASVPARLPDGSSAAAQSMAASDPLVSHAPRPHSRPRAISPP